MPDDDTSQNTNSTNGGGHAAPDCPPLDAAQPAAASAGAHLGAHCCAQAARAYQDQLQLEAFAYPPPPSSSRSNASDVAERLEAVADFVGPAPDLAPVDGNDVVADVVARPGPAALHDVAEPALGEQHGGGRVGSGAWLHVQRLQPIAQGSNVIVLQAAYSVAEIKNKGVSNAACDLVYQHTRNVLGSLGGVEDILYPAYTWSRPFVDDAKQYEFGWCPGCGFLYPSIDNNTTPPPSSNDTCLRRGHAKFKVRNASR